jgi:hypothetical protein
LTGKDRFCPAFLFSVVQKGLAALLNVSAYCGAWNNTLLALNFFTLLKKGDGIDLKCPVCSGKLDFDMKLKAVQCHDCGWHKILYKK